LPLIEIRPLCSCQTPSTASPRRRAPAARRMKPSAGSNSVPLMKGAFTSWVRLPAS